MSGVSPGVEYFLGVGRQASIATMYGMGPGASLARWWAGPSEYFARTIPISSLDTLLGAYSTWKRLFIGVEVERVEFEMRSGAETVLNLASRPVWLIEICLSEYRHAVNPHFAETFDLFWRSRYHVYLVGSNVAVTLRTISEWSACGATATGIVNYICIPNGCHAHI